MDEHAPSTDDSVTEWVFRAKDGDSAAIENLCQRYFEQLTKIARKKFGNNQRAIADEEDIALSVLDSYFRSSANGRFDNLRDRNDLWYLLLSMTKQRVVGQVQENLCKKRGEGKIVSISELRGNETTAEQHFVDHSPGPDILMMISDQCDYLIDMISDPIAKDIARMKLQNESNRDIAVRLEVPVCVVERKLKLIRKKWHNELRIDETNGCSDDTVEGT